MITQQNITAFVHHLYHLRYGTPAPQELIAKWQSLSNADIDAQLNNLFRSWNYTAQQQQDTINNFAQAQQPTTINKATIAPKKKIRLPAWLIFLIIFAPLAYIGYQYFAYTNMQQVYAVTNNLSVRNSNNEIIATLDLTGPQQNATVPSYTQLRAADNELYDKIIDDSGKPKKHRMVLLTEDNFWNFLLKKNNNTAFVNANYITTDKATHDMYKQVFGQLPDEQSNQLELKYRKIIVGCLLQDKTLRGKFIVPTCATAKKKKSSIIKIEIVPNNSMQVIARLSDNFFYSFYGELADEAYAKPQLVNVKRDSDGTQGNLNGDVYFELRNGNYYATACNGISLNLQSTRDGNGIITQFEEPTVVAQDSNVIMDIIDSIKSAIGQ